MSAAHTAPRYSPWKVTRNSRTMKFHVVRDGEDGLEFLSTPGGSPRAFKSGDAARTVLTKAMRSAS
jgi:hypothetical protein